MKLSDLIIEHGPYVAGDPLPGWMRHVTHTEALNELREELIAAREAREAREAGERYEVWGLGSDEFGAIVLDHRDCPDAWQAEMETTDVQPSLAELNRRAGEHAQVCR